MIEPALIAFPRIHTAIAEWLSCMVVLCPLSLRGLRFKDAGMNVLLLALLLCVFGAMEHWQAQGPLWMLLMAASMGLMLLRIGAHQKPAEALYQWAYTFLLAELAASLEWQLNDYLLRLGAIRTTVQTYICMAGVYVLFFGGMLCLRFRMQEHVMPRITLREALGAVGIAVGAFIISNIQFALRQSVFTASLGDGVLYAHTLVDISGLVMLYANTEQRREMALTYELDALTRLLERQYDQYRQFEANNEAIHRVYHDLKHQIAYLESETSLSKRMGSLHEMKEIIRTSESQVNTGNSVLDTLLTSKSLLCAQEGIQMTCYAEGAHIGFMDVMDVLSLFGNTLDNAIECERQVKNPQDKLIRVHVSTRDAFLLIRIDNFCMQPVYFEDGTPKTTKQDKTLHGYGLKSVRRAAEKYGGYICLEQMDDWFTVTILIPMPTGKPMRNRDPMDA